MVKRTIKSGFGITTIENDWSDDDWNHYQSIIRQSTSVGWKAIQNHRNLNADEMRFLDELQDKLATIREKYE